MFKRYRQFLIGFLVGALLFGTIPVGAAVQEYILTKSETKIIVDGTEFADDSLPILNYKGYNYIPAAIFKGICAKLGLSFEWVGEKKEIKISTGKGEVSMANSTTLASGVSATSSANKTKTTSDGLMIYSIDGREYVAMRNICDKYNKFTFGVSEQSASEKKMALKLRDGSKELISNMPTMIYNGMTYVTIDYYKSIILPLIQAEGN